MIMILSILIFTACNGQEKENIYIFFDSNNEETFIENYDSRKLELKKYRVSGQNNNHTDFKILKELFVYDKSKDSIKNINKENFEKIKFSSLEYMHQKRKESNLFSSQKVFNKIFLVKPTKNNKTFEI